MKSNMGKITKFIKLNNTIQLSRIYVNNLERNMKEFLQGKICKLIFKKVIEEVSQNILCKTTFSF